jgi:hypothetical protein
VQSHIAGRPIRRRPNEKRGKERRAKSICSANAIAPGRTSFPRLRAVVSYINDNREVVLEHTAMEIAGDPTSDATVVRAIQALGFRAARA